MRALGQLELPLILPEYLKNENGGRMGGKRVTYQNLKIMKILADRNVILIKGAIPGPKNSYVEITK